MSRMTASTAIARRCQAAPSGFVSSSNQSGTQVARTRLGLRARSALASPTRSRLLAMLSVFALLALTGPASADARLSVTGFQEESSPPSRIDRSAVALTTVGVDGVNLTAAGSVSVPDAPALRQLATAHRDHLRAELLVGNWDAAVGNFYEPLAHATLNRPGGIARVVRTLGDIVRHERWDGISVDLESLASRDRAGLSAFVGALHQALPRGATVSVCVSNFTQGSGFPVNGYDLAGLARSSNRIILMAYDEHGPWENTPGPIGALGWQRAGLAIVMRSVPAAKLDLGVAGYGYGWRPHQNVALSDAQARALIRRDHARARYIAGVGEWTARLADGSTLWWSDARSFKARAALARGSHLHGLAVWSLGQSDPIRS